MKNNKLLKLKKVEIAYSGVKVIWGIDIEVGRNEIVVIIGQNGAGKSTILSAIAGLIPVKNGKIFFKDESIENLDTEKIVKKRIMLVPEGAEVFPNMSVKDNLLMGAYTVKSVKEKFVMLDEILTFFPLLKEKLKQYAGTLSGGEKQILAIGRALMCNPELILLDEPSIGLQPFFVKKVFEIIEKLRSIGKTVLLVEQNINMALQISDRGYVLENGKVVLHDNSNNLVKNIFIKKAYLGIK